MGDASRFSPLSWLRGIFSPLCTLDPQEACVNMHLVKCCDTTGHCFPGLGPIASETRVSRSKVIASLAELEARGLVSRERQTRGAGLGSNRYTLPAEPPPSALGGLPRTQRRRTKGASPSVPGNLGSAPDGLPLVCPATLGSVPGTPYLDQDLILTTQGTGGLAPLAAPATPSPALELTVQDPRTKKIASEKPRKKKRQAKSSRKVPADWEPKESHQERAAELRVDLARAVDKFRRYSFRRALSDADQAFDNWLEREPEFVAGRSGGRSREPVQNHGTDPFAGAKVITG